MIRTMKTTSLTSIGVIMGFLVLGAETALPAVLGGYTFNDSQFGNTLAENDGGTFRNLNWLNIANANPGNPAALTGANFDTGIANIGLGGAPIYTIGYNTPIANNTGADLGIVTARFSSGDTFSLSVSTDGVNFTSAIGFGPGSAVSTGVAKNYFYGGSNGPYDATLFVTPVDLTTFGLAAGQTIAAVRVTSFPEGDLIRIAGLVPVPEPGSLSLMSAGLISMFMFIRRKK